MGEYGQFCPVAKAAEVLDERWTLLVVRELVAGSQRFNDLHRGVPRMSRSLLSKRLSDLTRQGLVARHEGDGGPRYELTDAGCELAEVVEVVGRWGIRWMHALGDADLDPTLLIWDMHRRVDTDAVPAGRTVVAVTFLDAADDRSNWWLVLTPAEADVCDTDPGYGEDVAISTTVRTMARVWRGDLGWRDALGSSQIRLHGPTDLQRQIAKWFLLSPWAATPRPG